MEDQLSALPKDLDKMYERDLLRSPDRRELKQCLLWLAFSTKPLRLNELADVVTVNVLSDDLPVYNVNLQYFEPTDILTICPSFIVELKGAF